MGPAFGPGADVTRVETEAGSRSGRNRERGGGVQS